MGIERFKVLNFFQTVCLLIFRSSNVKLKKGTVNPLFIKQCIKHDLVLLILHIYELQQQSEREKMIYCDKSANMSQLLHFWHKQKNNRVVHFQANRKQKRKKTKEKKNM